MLIINLCLILLALYDFGWFWVGFECFWVILHSSGVKHYWISILIILLISEKFINNQMNSTNFSSRIGGRGCDLTRCKKNTNAASRNGIRMVFERNQAHVYEPFWCIPLENNKITRYALYIYTYVHMYIWIMILWARENGLCTGISWL